MSNEFIEVKGAKVHNLKNIDVSIPKNKLVVCCGVSGSGKSSLAFDTIFAEGQRRYVESLSSYARQFLGQVDKPEVESITGLSPAVSIDQKSTSHNPRSTVGTVTEIWDHLRLLYARIGVSHCPTCKSALKSYSSTQLAEHLIQKHDNKVVTITSPIIRERKGSHQEMLSEFLSKGFTRIVLNGKISRLDEIEVLDKRKKHNIDLVVDRFTMSKDKQSRLLEDIELAYSLGNGLLTVLVDEQSESYSQNYSCPKCLVGFSKLDPKDFSFNSPSGACLVCDGLGYSLEVDISLIVENPELTLSQGALAPWHESSGSEHFLEMSKALLRRYKIDVETPYKKLPKNIKEKLLFGEEDLKVKASFNGREYMASFEGVLRWVERRAQDPWTESNKEKMEGYFTKKICSGCKGGRLNPRALNVSIAEKNIHSLAEMTVAELSQFFSNLKLNKNEVIIASRLVKEISERISFLEQVGLSYLTLSRNANSLSGGEAQRIRLASQIGSGLTGVLYVLDEPSIGLHQKDNDALIKTLLKLRDLGNTVLVVEHDEDTINQADYIVEIGPSAGHLGGTLVYQGLLDEFARFPSLTSDYLVGRKLIDTPEARRLPQSGFLELEEATLNNLKKLNAKIPLGLLTVVTGVSGSGKSTLVNDILAENMARALNKKNYNFKNVKKIKNHELLDKLVLVDQSPIGRTPRSNPASYTGLYDKIRDLFAQLPESKAKGWKVGRFSFNVPSRNGGGRCDDCDGQGTLTIEMSFLPDVHVPCDKCNGKRFTRETLSVKFKGKNISEVLEMSVSQAKIFFENVSSVKRHLETLEEVGLGYVKLGQTATTLSGGEAQRVKLASELLKRNTGRTLYILDEPSTGLHFEDVAKLIDVLEKLVKAGNTMVIIEHNLDIIRRADYIIELGPTGGPLGGNIIATGSPEEIAKSDCPTAPFLKIALENTSRKKINRDRGA